MTAPAPSNEIVKILTSEEGPESPKPPTPPDIPAVDPKSQWWYRDPGSSTRKVFEKIMVLRAAGHKDAVIAKKLKTTPGNVSNVVYIARKNGWLDANDEVIDIEAELALDIDRKIVRNISASLDGRMTNWQTHEMTIAAAKGRGHFKNHDTAKTDPSSQLSVVAIQVVMPPVGAGDQTVVEANLGGVPAYIEGEITLPEETAYGHEQDPAATDSGMERHGGAEDEDAAPSA